MDIKMKKVYINPTIEVVEIHATSQLLAGSTLGIGTGDVAPGSADAREFFEDDEMSLFEE